jgi:glutamine amidotransferase
MANLASVWKGLERAGGHVELTSDAAAVRAADGVVLPGVGAFGQCMENLRRNGMSDAVREAVAADKPFLGICLGLQALFDSSEESPGTRGLGIIPGAVKRFAPGLHVPHMGWNQVRPVRETPLLDGIADGDFFYFVHSFYVAPEDESVAATTTDYQTDFVSSVARGNLFACQFHPEKSQRKGLQILKNFVRLVGEQRREPA